MSRNLCNLSQRGVTLSNTLHSEVAPCLPLPSLPPFFGASDEHLRLFDDQLQRPLNRRDVLTQAPKIADLLLHTDVSYLNLKNDARLVSGSAMSHMDLCEEVLRYNRDAFQCSRPGPLEERISNVEYDQNVYQKTEHVFSQVEGDYEESHSHQYAHVDDVPSSSRKTRAKKKGGQGVSLSTLPDPSQQRDALVGRFCDFLEEFCSKAEVPGEERDESEWLLLSTFDVRRIVKEILSIKEEKLLHRVPIDFLVRLLIVLDHQIHRAEGLSIDENENSDSDVSLILCALESIHAALAVMAINDMPKQLYKEEVIERILEFTRRQVMDVMSAYDPSYRAFHRPGDNRVAEGDDDPDVEAEFGSASKRRRTTKSVKVKRTMANRIPAAVNAVFQKLCTVLGLLKDLLLVERLSDSCILQLVKTCLSTFLVDNIQLMQMKAMSLISGIFYSYTQHRSYVIEEVIQLLWKLPFSKRAARAYYLPDEEQKQIQMITALMLQLVLHSANLPEALRQTSNNSAIFETTIESNYLIKCNEAATEACVSLWTHILQRLTSKSQEASEVKVIMENLVVDLLTTLNLPEYPAASLILEVLCVLLLQNAGPKSKDISIRSLAIDILGTIAARLKHESVLCHRENFWMVQELVGSDNLNENKQTDACSVCLDGVVEKALVLCQGCQRLFHPGCMGVREHDISARGWQCPLCLCRKQLLVLQSYCKSQFDDSKILHNRSENLADESVSKMEIVQQMLLNYLEDMGSSDDLHLFARWLYLCLWYKDDPKSQQQLSYRLARLKSKSVIRDSGALSSLLTRESIKMITLCLGQHNSFSRGFDIILNMLLVSLRDNSPVIRAKALRAVSIIVEADPDVLRDKRVQCAVEGRFCDSAISVREAALELVGRHIASHPDVGLQYFEKVAERIKDTGVSVRKRAIKIIRDMYTTNADFKESAHACIEIISRISDEESSIQDLVCKTFHEFWFEEPVGRQYFGDDSSVPLEVARKTEQIVDMLRKMPNHQPLVTVIKRNLALDFLPQSKGNGVNPVLLATVRKRCEMMCKCSLERILQVEEMNTEEGELRILPYIVVLHAFCVVDPSLCAPASNPSEFVVTLQPYLKNQVDNRVMAKLLESVIFIIDAVLPLLRKLPTSVVEELQQDLKQMIVRHSFLTVVHACIKCLCSLNKIAGGKGARLIQFLIQVFIKRLDALGVDNKQQVGRSLFCLGLLIRYGSPVLSESNDNVDIDSIISLFKKYLLVDDFSIKVRALQALGFVLIARPEYMLEKDTGKILEATLSSSCDARLKLQALQNMYDYLLDAESQLGSDAVEDNVIDCSQDGSSAVPVAAGAGDTNICGGIVQLYWGHILERCLDTNEHIRQSGLKIVEVALRQGLVHPITCVPCLIALETDPLEVNSKLAHHLLMNMNEKYPAFFESRLGDGLQFSFNFIQSMSNSKIQFKVAENLKGKNEDASFANARIGVSRIYKLIRGNRLSRNKFMSSVIRKFDNPCWSETVVPFLMYCTEILAFLPFTVPDEPLYLVYTINRVIQVRSGTLEASLKAFSSHFSQRSSLKVLTENGSSVLEPSGPISASSVSFDLNGQVHLSENGHIQCTVKEENAYSRTAGRRLLAEDDQLRIQAVCLAATALQLLLKLKRHLKIVYNLDDVRCQAFSPAELPKSGEALSRQNIPFSIGVINTNLPCTSEELTQRYQEFKNALREDTIDYSTYTANIKRKRPPSKRGGRPSRMVGREDEDFDDDEEDWNGVGRRYPSGRQSNSVRGSRRS